MQNASSIPFCMRKNGFELITNKCKLTGKPMKRSAYVAMRFVGITLGLFSIVCFKVHEALYN